MGSHITCTYAATGQYLSIPLSNGATDVVNWALGVACSRWVHELLSELGPEGLTAEDIAWECDLARFFICRDRAHAYSSEGFEVGRLGWNPETFMDQRASFLILIQSAIRETDGELGRFVNVANLLLNLGALRLMVSHLMPADLPADTSFEWYGTRVEALDFCARHHILKHSQGCFLCTALPGPP